MNFKFEFHPSMQINITIKKKFIIKNIMENIFSFLTKKKIKFLIFQLNVFSQCNDLTTIRYSKQYLFYFCLHLKRLIIKKIFKIDVLRVYKITNILSNFSIILFLQDFSIYEKRKRNKNKTSFDFYR